MVDDIKSWKEGHFAQIEEQLSTLEGLGIYIKETLKNFCYRYIQTTDEEVDIKSPQEGFFIAESTEHDINKALQTKNPLIKQAIEKKQPKQVRYMLMCAVREFQKKRGVIDIVAVAHWGAPDFAPNSPEQKMKKIEFKFDDGLDFRNHFAQYLEQACELF